MRRFTLPLLLLVALGTTAQEKTTSDYGDFTIQAQLRTRGEYRNGQGTLRAEGDRPSWFINDRARLSLDWQRRNLSMRVSAQHTGVWGDTPQQNKQGDLSVHEAWAKMLFGNGFFAQAGRQVISYDDERLLGGLDWATTGRAHDALRLGWENNDHQLHAILAFNQTAETGAGLLPNDYSANTALYKNMQTLWYHYRGDQLPFHLSVLFMNQGVEDKLTHTVHSMQTIGGQATYQWQKLKANGSAYLQMGRDVSDKRVLAAMISAGVSYEVLPQLSLTLGDDCLSGDDGTSSSNHTFNVLYGTHHKFYGTMDYFSYNTIPLYGLNDLNLKADYRICDKLDASFAYHWFATSRRINNRLRGQAQELAPESYATMRRYNGEYRYSQNLGHEIDLQVNYSPMKDVTIQAGYSMMFASETMELVKKCSNKSSWQDWGWVSLNVSPTIFSTKQRR